MRPVPKPTPGKAPRTAKQNKRRLEVLHAAAAVFAEKGYHGATIKDVAERLGVRQASLYYYFDSKEAALEEICRIGTTEFIDNLKAIADSDAATPEKIRRAIRAHLEPLLTHRFYVHAFIHFRRDLSPKARRPIDATAREYQLLWQAMLAEGKRRGELPAGLDERMAVLAILGMLNSVVRWAEHEPEATLERIAGSFACLFLDGVRGPSR